MMNALVVEDSPQIARVIERLEHPTPGGKVEAAREFGVDLTLLVEQIKLSPADSQVTHCFKPLAMGQRFQNPNPRIHALADLSGRCVTAFADPFDLDGFANVEKHASG